MLTAILFYLAATGLVSCTLGVVLSRSPLRGAMALITALCFLALLFVLLDASFVAAMQILVYAGAIMVLFVFVIMMLDLEPRAPAKPAYLSISKSLGTVAAVYLLAVIVGAVAETTMAPVETVAADQGFGSVSRIGQLLLTHYVFGFEAISVLLLTAVVGAVVLGLKRLA